jgi:hypothetical protein
MRGWRPGAPLATADVTQSLVATVGNQHVAEDKIESPIVCRTRNFY